MSIDKESNGLPQVNVHRRTTKVNLGMIAAILVFFALAIGVAIWASRRQPDAPVNPSPSSRPE